MEAWRELVGIIGLALLGWGLWLAWPPLCPIAIGSLVLLFSVVGYLREPRKPTGKEAVKNHVA